MRSIRTLIPLLTFQFLILLSIQSQTVQKLQLPVSAEEFGKVVAIDGDTAIIGAPNTGPELGYAYIFEQQNSSWAETKELQAPGSSINFGASVDISGDVAVVGDPDGGDDGKGQVFIFHRDNNWQLKESLSMPGPLLDYGEKFGLDVAVHGKIAVVTLAHTPPLPGPGESGTLRYIAQVYVLDDNFNYSDERSLFVDNDTLQSDGLNADIFNDRVVVGRPDGDVVYVWDQTDWGGDPTQSLVGAVGSDFGASVAIENDLVAVGAPEAYNGSGAAYVFDQLIQKDELRPTRSYDMLNERFGYSIGLDGSTIIVGNKFGSNITNTLFPAVYVFEDLNTTGVWQETVHHAGDSNNAFGQAIDASSGTILIGAYKNSSSKGSVYIAPTAPLIIMTSWTGEDNWINFGDILTEPETVREGVTVKHNYSFNTDVKLVARSLQGTGSLTFNSKQLETFTALKPYSNSDSSTEKSVTLRFLPATGGKYLIEAYSDLKSGLGFLLFTTTTIVPVEAGITAPEADISVDPTSIDLGNLILGQAKSLTLKIENSGTGELAISSISFQDLVHLDPISDLNSINLAVNASTDIPLTFSVPDDPNETGDISGRIVITSNDPDQPTKELTISGKSQTAPQIVVDVTEIDLGTVRVGEQPSQTLIIQNTGQAILHVSHITPLDFNGLDLTDSDQDLGGFTVPGINESGVAGEWSISLPLEPTVRGVFSGELKILSGSSAGAETTELLIPITGTGAAPEITVTPEPAEIDFGIVGVDLERQFGITVQNDGDADLNLTGLELTSLEEDNVPVPSSERNQTLTINSTIDSNPIVVPNAVVSINLILNAKREGNFTGQLSLASDAYNTDNKTIHFEVKVRDQFIKIDEDTPYSDFTVEDFQKFYQTDVDNFNSVKITALSEDGTLKSSETTQEVGDEIQVADIDQLSFHPTSDWHGDTTFEFSINDDNTANPFIIIIQPINDAPTIVAEKELETAEDSSLFIFSANSHLQDYSYQDAEGHEWFNIQIVELPVEGTLELDGSQLQSDATLSVDQIERLEYIPKENWNGENGEKDTFKFKVNDNAVNTQGVDGNSYNPYSEVAIVSITVNAVNDAPTVTDATVSTSEDVAYTFSIQAFNQDYSDAESNTLVNVKIETLPNNGTLELTQQPVTANQEIPADQISQLTFVPIADWNDESISSNGANNEKTTFTFSVNDNGISPNLYSLPQTVTIDITPINDAPQLLITERTLSTTEDVAYTFKTDDGGVLETDYTDLEGDLIANLQLVSLPTEGTLALDGQQVNVNQVIPASQVFSSQGKLIFAPAADWHGTISFTYRINDDGQSPNPYSDLATINLTVESVNDPPGFSLSTTLIEVDEDFADTYTVTITPGSVPDDEQEQIVAYDLSPDPSTIDFATVSFAADQSEITITALADQDGTQPFYVTATETDADGNALSDNTFQQTLTLTVNSVNDPPTVQDQTVTTQEDQTYEFKGNDFKNGYQDIEQKQLANVKIVSLPPTENGVLKKQDAQNQPVDVTVESVISESEITRLGFYPVASWNGTTTFQFSVNDAEVGTAPYSQPATLTVTVEAVNDAPTVEDNTFTIQEDQAYDFQSADFQKNYSDEENDVFANLKIASKPADGTGKLYLEGNEAYVGQKILENEITGLRFEPAEDWSGTTSFTFRVNDDGATAHPDGNTQTITFTVTAQNDPPEFSLNKSEVVVDEDFASAQVVTVTSDPVPSDETNQSVSYTLDPSTTTIAEIAFNSSTGQVTITAETNGYGSQNFTIAATETENNNPNLENNTATQDFTLTIYPVNDLPVVSDFGKTTDEDLAYTFSIADFTDGMTDVENDTLTQLKIRSLPVEARLKSGTEVILGSNRMIAADQISQLQFIPDNNWHGTTTFTFSVSDVEDASSSSNWSDDATVTMVVNPKNDPPTFDFDPANLTTNEDFTETYIVAITSGSVPDDEQGQIVTYELSPDPSTIDFATVSFDSQRREITVEAIADLSGSQTFTVTATEVDASEFGIATATFTLTVTAINDPPTVSDYALSMLEDETHTFNSTTFTADYSDTEDNAIADIQILSQPTHGQLQLNGIQVELNQVIPSAQIPELSYAPESSWFGQDEFKFRVKDNGDSPNPYSGNQTVTISVDPLNNPPTIENFEIFIEEDQIYTFTRTQFEETYQDVEDNGLANVKIITLPGAGQLHLGELSLTTDVLSTDNAIVPVDQLNQLTFTPPPNWNDQVDDNDQQISFTFSVNDDGDSPNPYSSNQTLTVSVAPLNDPPRFSLSTELVEVDEDFETSQVITVTPESIPIGETDQIVTYHLSPETVDFADLSINPETGAITITAISNLEGDEDVDVVATEYLLTPEGETEQLLENETFETTFTLTVNAVNDPPVISDLEITTGEDEPYTFDDLDFQFEDAETDDLANVKILTLPENGKILFDEEELQSEGNLIEINQLDRLVFQPDQDWYGETHFQISANDDGQTVTTIEDTPYSQPVTVTFTVTSINDPPTISEPIIQTEENLIYLFSVDDFQLDFIDPEGDQLARIQIETSPENGQLLLGEEEVDSSQVIPVDQLDLLRFSPSEDWFGTAEFSFSLSDDGPPLADEDLPPFSEAFTALVAVTEDDNQSPELTALTIASANEGEEISFELVSFVDEDPREGEVRLATINWGDETEDSDVEVTLENPTTGKVVYPHTFKNEGLYTAQVTVFDGRGGIGLEAVEIEIKDVPPTFVVETTEINGQEGQPVNLADFKGSLSDPGLDDTHNITVDWGDETTDQVSIDNSVTPEDVGQALLALEHIYPDSADYTVTLVAVDTTLEENQGQVTLTAKIENLAPEIGEITLPENAAEGDELTLEVVATDAEADQATLSYIWDFGDGTLATEPNLESTAIHTFPDSGDFEIRLTVTDDDGGTSEQTIQITVDNIPPEITELPDEIEIEEGAPLELAPVIVDAGQQDSHTFSWNFGDESPLVESPTVAYAYQKEGSYQLTLTVTDDNGGSTTQEINVTVTNVVAEITQIDLPDKIDEGNEVEFAVQLEHPTNDFSNLTYIWDFGDGSEAKQNPDSPQITHSYADDGEFEIRVKVENKAGDQIEKVVQVKVQNLPPEITNFVVPEQAKEGQELAFEATAVDPAGDKDSLAFSWDFGDDSKPITGDKVTYAFGDNGAFTVKLTVTDDEGASVTKTATVTVENVAPKITEFAKQTEVDEGVQIGFSVVVNDPGRDDEITYVWDFGDGSSPETVVGSNISDVTHIYTDNGEFELKLSVSDDDGGSDQQSKKIVAQNVPPFVKAAPTGKTIKEGDQIVFSTEIIDAEADLATLIYTWDFGDGSEMKESQHVVGQPVTIKHAYVKNGEFIARMKVADKDGAVVEKEAKVVVQNVEPVIVKVPQSTTGDEGQELSFSAEAEDFGLLTYTWDFGDGSEVATGPGLTEVKHTYPDDGKYKLTLSVTDVNDATVARTADVTINNLPPEFTEAPEDITINEGETIQRIVKAIDPAGEIDPVTYAWDFGDRSETVKGLAEIEHTYRKRGSYTVVVTAKDDDGGEIQHQFIVDVKNIPPEIKSLISSTPEINEGEEVVLTAEASDSGRLLYEWDFGDDSTVISGANLTEIQHIFMEDDTYTVELTVTDTDEAQATKELEVIVSNLPPKAVIETTHIIDEKSKVTLDASGSSDPGNDALVFEWDLDENGQVDEEGEILIYEGDQLGQHKILLIVSEENNPEAKDEVQISIEVLNVPPEVSAGGPYAGELNEQVPIDGATAGDPADPTGETFTYAWDLDDDGTFETREKEPSFSRTESGNYKISLQVQEKDGDPVIATTIVAIKKSGNIDPVAGNDLAETSEDEPVVINVLVNDSDPEAEGQAQSPLKVISATPVEGGHGTTEINPDGTIIYTPGQDVDQDDSFTYTIIDPDGGIAEGTVTVKINPINDPPDAKDDDFSIGEDTPLKFTILQLVKNDVDPDTPDEELELESVSNRSARGITIVDNGDGTFAYQPEENFFGQDSFSYVITDGQGGGSGAKVNLTILPVNDPPVPTADSAELPEDTKGYPIDVLINDTDADGDTLTVLSVTEAENGVIDLDTMIYTPLLDFSGKDEFTYIVSDGKGEEAKGTVTIMVTAVNDLPVAVKQSINTDEDTLVELTLVGQDADKEDLLYEVVQDPLNGKLEGDSLEQPFADGQKPKFTYRPNSNYYGEDYFSFRVSDSSSPSLVAKISLTINSVYDPPQFVTQPEELTGQYKTGQPIETLIKVINFEEEELNYTSTGLPSEANIQLRPVLGGVIFKWLPTYAHVGIYDVTIKASESELKFSMEIIPVNRTPILDPIGNIVDNSDTPSISVPLTAYDPDPESQLTFVISRLGATGGKPQASTPTLKPNAEKGGTDATASLIWEPDMAEDGGKVIEFILTVSDEKGLQAKRQFSIGLGEVNTPPTLSLDQTVYNVRESIRSALQGSQNRLLGNAEPTADDAVTIQLLAADAEKDNFLFEAESLPEGANLDAKTGLFTWEPDTKAGDGPGGAKIWTILFRVREDRTDQREALSDEISVRIRVKDRNILPVLLMESNGKLKTIDEIPDQQANEGEKLVVLLQALDYDGDDITFVLNGMPLGAKLVNISPGRAQFEWTPPFDAAGREPIVVTVKALDAKGAVTTKEQSKYPNSIPFTVIVKNTNQPPQLIGELVDQTIDEGKALQFPVVFTDPDLIENPDESITLTLENAPPAADGRVAQVIDSGDGTGTFSWQTTFDSSIPEGYQPIVIATDSQGARTEILFQVIVQDVNRPPQFDLIEVPPRIVEGDEIIIPLLAKDLDDPDEPLRFAARVKGGYLKDRYQIAGRDLLVFTKIGDAETYTVKLTVFDTENASAETKIDLVIRPRNLPPTIADLPPTINIVEGETVKLAVQAVDPNDHTLQSNFQVEPKAIGATFEAGVFNWASKIGDVGQYKITFSVVETETTEKFKAIVSTQLVVIERGDINLTNADLVGAGGTVKITFDLEVGKGGRADINLAVETRGEFIPLDTLSQLQTTPNVTYDWDTRETKNSVPPLGLEDRPYYRIRLVATDGEVSSPPVIIGPVLIDNQPPAVSLPEGQPEIIEAGTGNVAHIAAVATDNDQIGNLRVVFVDRTETATRINKQNLYEAPVVVPASPLDLLRAAGITEITLEMLAKGIDYPYRLEATDQAGNRTLFPKQTDEPLILRLRDALPPKAEVTPKDMTVSQGSEVTLNGRDSSDNSQRVVEYIWDLDDTDGINFDGQGVTGKIVTFVATKSVAVSLRVKDPAGNTGTESIQITVVDKTPPEPPTFKRFKPAIISERQALIQGTTEPRAQVEISVQGTTGLVRNVQADAKGNFTLLIEDLDDSTYKIGGTATDASNNTSLQAAPATLIVDTTPPEVKIVFDVEQVPGQQNRLLAVSEIANVRPQIPIEVTDRGGLAFVDLFLMEGYAEVSLDGGKRRSGGGGFSITEKVIPLRDLVDGITYQVKVVALDLAQQRTETKLEFKINREAPDRTAPQVVFTSPGIEGMFTGNANLPIQANLSDAESGLDLNLENIQVGLVRTVDAEPIQIQPLSLDSSDIKAATIMTFPVEPLPTGQYTVSVSIKDLNNNAKRIDRSFQVLGVPPAPTIPQLNRLQDDVGNETVSTNSEGIESLRSDSAEFTNTAKTTIEGQLDITYLPGGGSVEFFVNGNVVATAPIDAVTGNYIGRVPLVEGKNEIMLVAVNAIRKKSQPSVPTYLILDTQSPIVEALEPANGSILRHVSEIRAILKDSTVVSTAISGVDFASIQIFLDNQPLVANDPKTPDVDGWQYDSLSGQFIAALAEPFADQSAHTIKVQLADRLGNFVVRETNFKIETDLEDTTPPVISGLSPTAGATLNGEDLAEPSFALRGAAYDIESGLAEVQIRLDGKTIDSKVFAYRNQQKFEDPGKIEFRPESITDGHHLLTIYARDKSDNEKLVHSKFFVDAATLKPVFDPIPEQLNKRRVKLEGTAEPFADIQILVNEKPAGTVTVDENGRFTQPGLALDEGSNVITAIASDKGNNVSDLADPLEVLADIRAPLVGNPEPKPGLNLKQSVFTIGADLGDNPGGSGIDITSIQLVLDGSKNLYEFEFDEKAQTPVRISYTPSVDSAELTEFSEGKHTFRLVVSDLAGNTTTFNSGQFFVNFTPPTIDQNLPKEGDILSNGDIEITVVSEEEDLAEQAFSLRLFNAGGETVATDEEYDPLKGRLRVKPQAPLADGEYSYLVSVVDLAGNRSEKTVKFKVDSEAQDDSPPTIMPQFPQPGQEVSSTNFMAMEFQVVDSDSQVGFEEMSVEINGVVYNELFGAGSANRFNRDTGDVVLYARLQLELGGLEDPLELGGLEDPLELGGLEDPLELGGLEDPLELGGLEDPLELGGLEDPLELGALEDPLDLGALERPLELATGLNAITITVPDMTGNFSQLAMNFDVTLESPEAPQIMAGPPPPPLDPGIEPRFGEFFVGQVGITPYTIRAGEAFDISFNATQDVVAAFLDLARLDSTLPEDATGLGLNPPPWSTDDDRKVIWEQIVNIPQERPDLKIDLFKFAWLELNRITPKPYAVPAGAERYQAVAQVSEETQTAGGDETIRLFVVKQNGESGEYFVDYRQLFVGFENPTIDGGKSANRVRRGRQASRLFSNRMVSSSSSQDDKAAPGEFEFEAYFIEINEEDGKIYTNTPEVPLVGQMAEVNDKRNMEVEIFVNDNTMGIADVSPDGVFSLPRILLDAGSNKVTAFSRSESQLQSPVSPPMIYFLDQEAPKIEFVELPTHASLPAHKIQIRYQDNSGPIAQSITLVLNEVPIAIDNSTSEPELTIDLEDGANKLGLSAIDPAGNVSEVVETTLTLSNSPPETAPTDLKSGLGFSGTEIVVRWTADSNAQSYNVYRSESEIFDAVFLNPIQPKLSRTAYTDVNVDLGTTYFYALTSISPSGLPGAATSENINVTIISASKGGTAALADGTRITAKRRAISRDATLFTAVSIFSLPDGELLPLPGAIEGSARQFSAFSQSGDLFISKFSKPATVAIPYSRDYNAADLGIFRLVDGQENPRWEQITNIKSDEQKQVFTFSARYFETYRLSGAISRPWDINADQQVNIQDMVIVATNFSQTGPAVMGDVNADQVVNIQDLVTVASHFGEVYDDSAATAPLTNADLANATLSLSADISDRRDHSLSQVLQLSIALSQTDLTAPMAGYQFGLSYDPYLLAVVDIDRTGDTELDHVKPVISLGAIKNITGLQVIDQSMAKDANETRLAHITFRLKGDQDEAVNSIQIQNLVLVDTQSSLIPVRVDPEVIYRHRSTNPLTFELGQNYPNPFNPETWIPYQLAKDSLVEIEIYSATGVLVRQLDIGFKTAGNYTSTEHSAYWNGRNRQSEKVASGVYFYRIKAHIASADHHVPAVWRTTKKMIILK